MLAGAVLHPSNGCDSPHLGESQAGVAADLSEKETNDGLRIHSEHVFCRCYRSLGAVFDRIKPLPLTHFWKRARASSWPNRGDVKLENLMVLDRSWEGAQGRGPELMGTSGEVASVFHSVF